jgi:hypothetical protein
MFERSDASMRRAYAGGGEERWAEGNLPPMSSSISRDARLLFRDHGHSRNART